MIGMFIWNHSKQHICLRVKLIILIFVSDCQTKIRNHESKLQQVRDYEKSMETL